MLLYLIVQLLDLTVCQVLDSILLEHPLLDAPDYLDNSHYGEDSNHHAKQNDACNKEVRGTLRVIVLILLLL